MPMSRELTSALLVTGYGRGCGVPYGGDRQDERQNSDRTMVQKAVVGDSARVSSLHLRHS